MNSNLHFSKQDELKGIEGFRSTVYPDASGHSIGYGTYLTPTEYAYWKDKEIDKTLATVYLNRKIVECETVIYDSVKVKLNQNQFDALVLFIYNVGVTAFKTSTMLVQLNINNLVETACEFIRWHHSMHKDNLVLLKRRVREIEIFLT
jgi:lysozyme